MEFIKKIWNNILPCFFIKRRCFLKLIGKSSTQTISYAITVCNEAEQLNQLLNVLYPFLREGDEIRVQADKTNVTEEVKNVIREHRCHINGYEEFPLNFDFANFKNHLNQSCRTDYIFQLDADELPQLWLMQHLTEILKTNADIELFKIPRINIFSENQDCRTNWPDYQGRIFRNNAQRIYWYRPLHERIHGYKSYTYLPKDDNYAILHIKSKLGNDMKWKTYFAQYNQVVQKKHD